MLRVDLDQVAGGEVTVAVRGELDTASAARFRAAITALLNNGKVRTVGLDLRGLTLVDSAGVGTLVVAHRICAQVGVRLHLVAVSPFAARVLGVAGVTDVFAGR